MKKLCFDGVAVHPKLVTPEIATMVGVWLWQRISSQQRRDILKLNRVQVERRIGVHRGKTDTAVICLVRVEDAKAARQRVQSLARSVAVITGAKPILRQLPNYRAVRRALAL